MSGYWSLYIALLAKSNQAFIVVGCVAPFLFFNDGWL